MKKFFVCSLPCFLFLWPVQLFAQEKIAQGIFKEIIKSDHQDEVIGKFFEPAISGQFVADLNFDNNYQTTNRQDEYKEAYGRGRLASKISLNKNFSLNSLIRLDRANTASEQNLRALNPSAGNQYFENQTLFAQEIVLTYENKNTSLLAGKFTPNFGTAWQWGRGIWSHDLARNYKENEKLGVGGIYRVGNLKKVGLYNFGLAAFTNDRNNLDNSLITKSLKSYVASLDILFAFSKKEQLSYHFSYIDMAVNSRASSIPQNKIDSQKGIAAGMNYRYPINDYFLLDTLLEYVDLKNIGGNSDVGQKYSTVSFVGEICRNWNVTAATTNLAQKQINQNGFDQNLSEISVGYKFDKTVIFDKLLLQVGYKNSRTNYKTSVETNNSYGVLMRYIKSF